MSIKQDIYCELVINSNARTLNRSKCEIFANCVEALIRVDASKREFEQSCASVLNETQKDRLKKLQGNITETELNEEFGSVLSPEQKKRIMKIAEIIGDQKSIASDAVKAGKITEKDLPFVLETVGTIYARNKISRKVSVKESEVNTGIEKVTPDFKRIIEEYELLKSNKVKRQRANAQNVK